MKRILSFIFSFTLVISAWAQEPEKITDDGDNELKLNMGYLVFEILEINYERILNDEFSVGVGASYWFAEGDNTDYVVNPFFRFYPINTPGRAATFFIEGNAGIVGGTERQWVRNGVWEDVNFLRAGAGVAAGAKFLSKNNFVGEAYLGVGRIFDSTRYLELYPRVGVTFGKRF